MTDHRPLDERDPDDRRADHQAIDRLAQDVLPALAERLAATGLGELEVREGGWKIRLRRGTGHATTSDRSRHGHRPDGSRSGRTGGHGHAPGEVAGPDDQLPALTSIGAGVPDPLTAALALAPLVARSPGVGVFHAPAGALAIGTRLAAGDPLGRVDVLGVAQEVVAPGDGVVSTTFVEDGDVVEYGQPLVGLRPVREGVTSDGATPAASGAADGTGDAAELAGAARPAAPVGGGGAA